MTTKTKRNALSRMPHRGENNREKGILKRASRLFRERGYDATTMDDIAKATGMLKGSLYHFFSSKEEILYRIAKPPLEATVAFDERVVASDLSPTEKLHLLLRRHLESFDRFYPESFVSALETFATVGRELRQDMTQLRARYVSLWDAVIAAGIESGHFRRDLDIRATTHAIMGMCNWLGHWYRKGKRLTALEIADLFYGLLTRGILSDRANVPGPLADAVGRPTYLSDEEVQPG